MLVPSDFQDFLNSDIAKDCEKALLRKPKGDVVPSNYYNMRDYLLLRLLQRNAQRPMAIRNITKRAIENSKISEDGVVITVSKYVVQISKIK